MDGNIEKVVSVFEVGEVIYIKHESILESILCIIEKIDENNIYFKVPDAFVEKNILTGDKVYCHILKDNFEYVVFGEIQKIEIKPTRYVCVSIDQYNKHKNNRVFARYNVKLSAIYTLDNSALEHYILINNISILGAAIISKENLEKDEILYLKIKTMLKNTDLLEFKAKVIRKFEREKFNEYGIEIIEIDFKNRDILDKLLFNLNLNEENYIEDLKKSE